MEQGAVGDGRDFRPVFHEKEVGPMSMALDLAPNSHVRANADVGKLPGWLDALRRPLARRAGRAISGGHRRSGLKEEIMEFPVEFELDVPEGTPESDVKQRYGAEAGAACERLC